MKKYLNFFHRLHDKDTFTGTGIGLAICSKIVENHGGFITADGQFGKGSVFNIYSPVTSKEVRKFLKE
jgi:light-regulated signal transduction histidine kinase (bacteriophytochrome)